MIYTVVCPIVGQVWLMHRIHRELFLYDLEIERIIRQARRDKFIPEDQVEKMENNIQNVENNMGTKKKTNLKW